LFQMGPPPSQSVPAEPLMYYLPLFRTSRGNSPSLRTNLSLTIALLLALLFVTPINTLCPSFFLPPSWTSRSLTESGGFPVILLFHLGSVHPFPFLHLFGTVSSPPSIARQKTLFCDLFSLLRRHVFISPFPFNLPFPLHLIPFPLRFSIQVIFRSPWQIDNCIGFPYLEVRNPTSPFAS